MDKAVEDNCESDDGPVVYDGLPHAVDIHIRLLGIRRSYLQFQLHSSNEKVQDSAREGIGRQKVLESECHRYVRSIH